MNRVTLCIAASALALVAGTTVATADPPPTVATADAASDDATATRDAPPERLIGLLEELAGALETAGVSESTGPETPVDCDAVAGALDAWTRDHADELSGLVTSVDDYLDALPRSELRGLETRLAPYVDAVVVAAIDCAEHDGTMAALDSMESVLAPARESASEGE